MTDDDVLFARKHVFEPSVEAALREFKQTSHRRSVVTSQLRFHPLSHDFDDDNSQNNGSDDVDLEQRGSRSSPFGALSTIGDIDVVRVFYFYLLKCKAWRLSFISFDNNLLDVDI